MISLCGMGLGGLLLLLVKSLKETLLNCFIENEQGYAK